MAKNKTPIDILQTNIQITEKKGSLVTLQDINVNINV